MRVKVDEDLPAAVVQMLLQQQHDAASVVAEGMGGSSDLALWRSVQVEQRFLVTADKGFGDIRHHPPGTHAGVLLLRPDQDGIGPIVELLERILREYDLDALSGSVTVATPRGIRIRRAQTVEPDQTSMGRAPAGATDG